MEYTASPKPQLSSRANAFSIAALMSSGSSKEKEGEENTIKPLEQFVEKSSCSHQSLSELSGLQESHQIPTDFSGVPHPLCTEPLIPTSPGIPSEEMAKIGCSLETKELWDKFHDLGTEMIITKSGRWGRTKNSGSYTDEVPEKVIRNIHSSSSSYLLGQNNSETMA